MRSFTHKTRVAWVDTDTSGRIHYTAAMRWFEAAEHALMREVYAELGSPERVNLPRVHVEADYQGALLFEDEIACTAEVERVGGTSITYRYRVVNRSGETCVTGKIVAVAIGEDQRPCRLPDLLRKALESG